MHDLQIVRIAQTYHVCQNPISHGRVLLKNLIPIIEGLCRAAIPELHTCCPCSVRDAEHHDCRGLDERARPAGIFEQAKRLHGTEVVGDGGGKISIDDESQTFLLSRAFAATQLCQYVVGH